MKKKKSTPSEDAEVMISFIIGFALAILSSSGMI